MKQAVLFTFLMAASMLVGWSIMAHAYAPGYGLPLFVMPGWKTIGAMFGVSLAFGIPLLGGYFWLSSLGGGRDLYLVLGIGITVAFFWVLVKLQLPLLCLFYGLSAGLMFVMLSRAKPGNTISKLVHIVIAFSTFQLSCSEYGRHLLQLPPEIGGQKPTYFELHNPGDFGYVLLDVGEYAYIQMGDETGNIVMLMPSKMIRNSDSKDRRNFRSHPPTWRIRTIGN